MNLNVVKTEITLDGEPCDFVRMRLDQSIRYIARHRKTSFAFLSRVLASYGEWFFYDGKKLILGRPMEEEPVTVTFDVELSEVQSTAKVLNLKSVYYDYNPERNTHFTDNSTTISNANLPMMASRKVSLPIYPNETIMPVGRSIFPGFLN